MIALLRQYLLQEDEEAIEEVDMEEDAKDADDSDGQPKIKRLHSPHLKICSIRYNSAVCEEGIVVLPCGGYTL